MGRAAPPAPVRLDVAAQVKSHAPLREVPGGPAARTEVSFQPGNKAVDRIAEGQKTAAELQHVAAENPDPHAVMERARQASVPSLSAVEQKNLQRINPTIAREADQFDTYSSIVSEAALKGQTLEQVAAARGLPASEFTAMRTEVLTRMGNMNYLKQTIPGLDQMSQETRATFVENYFAANPAVREAYIGQMHAVAERAAGIPEAAGSGNPQQKERLLAERTTTCNQLRTRLGEAGKDLTDQQIADMFQGGRTVEEVRAQVFDRSLQGHNINAADVRARAGYQTQINSLNSQITLLEQQIGANPPNRDALILQRDGLERQRNTARDAQSKIVFTESQQTTINEVSRSVYGFVDDMAGGIRVGGITAELQSISQNLSAEQRLNATPQTVQEQAAEAQRQLQMEQLRQQAEGAMEKAVDHALGQAHIDANELQERKVLAQAEIDEKAGRERMADAERRMVIQEDADWVGKDKAHRKRIVRRDQIGADAKRVANDGEEGVRRIMLRQMAAGESPLINLTVDGKPGSQPLYQLGADGKPILVEGKPVPATWETVQESQLQATDRELLGQLYDKQHVQLEDRLMRDFDFAKHPRGIKDSLNLLGSLDSLRLTKDEYGYLHEQFGGRMAQAAEASAAMRNITAELKAQGIEPSGIMAILMFLLALGGGFAKKTASGGVAV